MLRPSSVRVSGPLAVYRDGFWAELMAQGYAPGSACNILRVMSHLSRWLAARRFKPRALDARRVEQYARHRRRSGYTTYVTSHSLESVLGYLRRIGAVPRPQVAAVARTPLATLLGSYEGYLTHERALDPATISDYLRTAQQFLSGRGDRRGLHLERLTTSDVTSFVLREAPLCRIGYAKKKVCGLRSLLRFLHVRGLLGRDLTAAVPCIAGWRVAGLPTSLTHATVQLLLRSCDRRTHIGLRDYAVLLLLVRLGLRSKEVASLTLDDLHWREGEIVVRGKGRVEDRLPLPTDVGEALAAYVRRARPRTESRGLFQKAIAPRGNLGSRGVQGIVATAAARVGLGRLGTHRLRHTAATLMLRRGAPLTEVAQVLRHRSIDTTAIYAKVDHARLELVARRWPGRAR